jgi:hypothetical protein
MRTFITAVILTTSLALSGNIAMAAQTHAKTAATRTVTHKVQPRHVVVRRRAPAQQQAAFPGILGAMFGSPSAYATPATSRGKADVDEYVSQAPPTYDSSPTVDNGAWVQQQIDNAEATATLEQQIDNDMMEQQMQAAEEQNDEANAATLQTEINAGM